MAKIIIASLLFLMRPAFSAEPVPVSSPPVVSGHESDSDSLVSNATVAITAALIAAAILYVIKDRSGLVDNQPMRPWRFFIDQESRIGIMIDF